VTGLQALHVRPGHPEFLDLPWERPLGEWRDHCRRIVDLERGLSRHEVQFVSDGSVVYAFKELPDGLAEPEYDILVRMEQRDLPAVTPIGHARIAHADGERTSMLVTRYLEASLPFRTLFQRPGLERYRSRLIDAMAGLLVRLHVAGVYWGDCSLSNALFRRDAGELRAYLVDAETSEMHDSLSSGLREQDLLIMDENVDGDVADLAAQAASAAPLSGSETGRRMRERYEALWGEIMREETIPAGELWRVHERVRSLNAIGFSVGEIELEPVGEGHRLRLRTVVTDRDHHRHAFHDLTGLVAGDRQAEQLLNDLREFRLALAAELGRSVPMSVAAFRWRTERWDPARAALQAIAPDEADAVERFCQVLEHKWFLSERAQRDVGFDAALEDYVARFAPAPHSAPPVSP
jgi:hypothetical protein